MKITFFILMQLGNGLLSCWHGLFKRVAKLVYSGSHLYLAGFRASSDPFLMASRESSDLLVVSNFGGVRAFPVWPQVLKVVYHLPQIPGNFVWDVNGKRFRGASQWKIPGTNGNSEKVVPFFPVGTFRREIRLPFTSVLSFVLVSCFS